MKTLPSLLVAILALALLPSAANSKTKDGLPLIVLIADRPSHGPGLHEYNAGVLLFAKCLQQKNAGQFEVKTHLNGDWPDAAELAQADSILIYSDGGDKHPALLGDRLAQLGAQMKRGCGLVCLHYALELPKQRGGAEFRDWLGGYFEVDWSINPRWTAEIQKLPEHPILNGIKPFLIADELYYHMRFKDGMAGVTPIFSPVPPESSVWPKDNARGGNPAVRAEVAARTPQPIAWAVERPDGGRGFGFTGGHTHREWIGDDPRKAVLNALLWTAKIPVPPNGVQSTVTAADITANLDPKGRAAQAAPAPSLPSPPPPAPAPQPIPPAAATAGRTAQGLRTTRYPIHPKQADGKFDGEYVPYTEFGKPIGSPRAVRSISPWEKAVDENAVAIGFIRIDRPGVYEFHSMSDWDRNELWIDGKIVCPFRDGRNGKHKVELRAGLLPIVSVGYAHATKSVTVEWRPPGQAEWSEIPANLFSH